MPETENASTPAQEAPIDPGVEQMSAEFFGEEPPAQPDSTPETGGDQPTATERSSKPADASPKGRSAQAPTDPKAASAQSQAPAPVETKFKIGGAEFTAAQLAEKFKADPEFAVMVATRAEQTNHYREKWEKAMERFTEAAPGAAPAAPAQPQKPDPQQIKFAHQQLRQNYEPEIAELVKAGVIEPDVAELYPDTMTQVLLIRDIALNAANTVNELMANIGQGQAAQRGQQVRQHIDAMLDSVVREGGKPFEELATPEGRKAFWDFLIAGNPMTGQITPDYLSRQWVAYKSPDMLAVVRAVADKQAADAQARRRNAVGDTGGSRPSMPAQADEEPWADTNPEGFGPRRG